MTFPDSAQNSFHNVEQYPSDLLQKVNDSVQVPVTYRKVWDDGFGARGWKVNATRSKSKHNDSLHY